MCFLAVLDFLSCFKAIRMGLLGLIQKGFKESQPADNICINSASIADVQKPKYIEMQLKEDF